MCVTLYFTLLIRGAFEVVLLIHLHIHCIYTSYTWLSYAFLIHFMYPILFLRFPSDVRTNVHCPTSSRLVFGFPTPHAIALFGMLKPSAVGWASREAWMAPGS